MKHQADKGRSERSFEIGDMVYLKLQPHIQSSVAPRSNHKLSFKFFGPFKVLQKVGSVAYKLDEGPIRRTREGGGSEWEPIKILLEGDENSNKTNAASNTRLRLTTQVGQAHVATGVPLDLVTNTHDLPTRERSGTPNLESTDPHRSDR
jgi:hypothetical protein